MDIRLHIFFILACLLNCCNEHINNRKDGQPHDNLKFESDLFAHGLPAQITRKQHIHKARVTTDTKMAVSLHYQVTYLKDVEYRLRVFKKIQHKLTKLNRKLATEAFKIIVGTMALTDLLVYIMLACKDQNGKVSTFSNWFLVTLNYVKDSSRKPKPFSSIENFLNIIF